MRDGQECTISIISSFNKEAAIFYELQIIYKGQAYITNLRYSALRKIVCFLPNCSVKFPQPKHFTSLISQVTGNKQFFKTRQEQLSLYFENISKITDLENSLGITMLVQKAVRKDGNADFTCIPPSAPRICGKRLVARVIEE